jgi:hypothetical protein
VVTTTWGFYVNPNIELALIERLEIHPGLFYSTMVLITLICFGLTYAFLRYVKVRQVAARARGRQPPGFILALSRKWVNAVILSLVIFQGILNVMAYQSFEMCFQNLSIFQAGAILISLSIIVHLYRYGIQLPRQIPTA